MRESPVQRLSLVSSLLSFCRAILLRLPGTQADFEVSSASIPATVVRMVPATAYELSAMPLIHPDQIVSGIADVRTTR
jgi:hypothetical protein